MNCKAARAGILWVGGEDIDFPNGVSVCTNTNGSYFRTGYARFGVYTCGGGIAQSNAFKGGGVTSVWLSAHVSVTNNYTKWVGLGKIGSTGSLWLGNSAIGGNYGQLALWTYNAGTWTRLAYEPMTSLVYAAQGKVDMQVISYGASATVNVYANGTGTPVITYTGNVVTGGNLNLDSVVITGISNEVISEVIVSTSDTRALSLATMAPSGAGTVNQWTGTYSNISPNSYNDTVFITDNTSSDVFESTVNAIPSGNFGVPLVKIGARGAQAASGLTSISVGVKTNGSTNAPAAVAQSTTFGETETYYSTNPVTSTNWVTTDLSSLQLNFTSAP